MEKISSIGLDIAKNSFAVHGFDAGGKTVLKKQLKRAQVLPFFAKLGAARIGLEACASAHHWARELIKLGHDARLIPAQRLATVPGIGTLIATLLSATVSDAAAFKGGREFAAWTGLVPRQHSTGGKPRLGPISKMGNRDLRRLLVVGAHAALYRIKSGKTKSPLADWARKLLDKKPFKLVAVALANKMARIAWAIMAGKDCYNPQHAAAAH